MNTPHPHKDLIIAWANGAKIQCKVPGQITDWADQTYPVWLSEFEYRIKPDEPKPKIKRW